MTQRIIDHRATRTLRTNRQIIEATTHTILSGLKAPYGWLKCNGQLVSKKDFPELAKVMSDQFVNKNLFKLPNKPGTVIKWRDVYTDIHPVGTVVPYDQSHSFDF
jgi:microcystin-dependent protein